MAGMTASTTTARPLASPRKGKHFPPVCVTETRATIDFFTLCYQVLAARRSGTTHTVFAVRFTPLPRAGGCSDGKSHHPPVRRIGSAKGGAHRVSGRWLSRALPHRPAERHA